MHSQVPPNGWFSLNESSGALVVVGCLCASVCATSAAPLQPPAILQQVCYECHGDGLSKGSFALDALIAKGATPAQHGAWMKVWKNVRHEFMPPATGQEITEAERREIVRWIEQAVFAIDPQRVDPGAVTIRRLNREEYQHTINDLFGIELDLRDQLLPDDSAHGFDNIGDAQTLSPVLFNRYLDLAEYIVGQVVVDTGPPLPRVLSVDLRGPRPSGGLSRRPLVAKDGVIEREFPVELGLDGRFRVDLDVAIGGWQDYGGDVKLEVSVDDRIVGERVVPFGGEVEETHAWDFTATKGLHLVRLRAVLAATPPLTASAESVIPENNPPRRDAPAAAQRPVDPERAARRAEEQRLFEEEFGRPDPAQPRRRNEPEAPQLRFSRLEIALTGPFDAGVHGEYPAAHQKIFFRGAAPRDAAGRRAYATEILRRFAGRAFHRPVDEPTLTRLVELALDDDNFERGVGLAISAVLSSPRFLFREEPQPEPDNPRVSHALDEYALASRLSYFLWLSIPDDELYAHAAAGTLRANLAAQVQRMLADPKSERFLRDFTGQWLRTRNVLMTAITPGAVATRLDPVREEMKVETDLLFEHIVREDRDLLELITADYTFLNEELAKWYGIEGVTGPEMRKVTLSPESHRGGVLTHGSILVSTSNPNRTSPVKRGVFVLENIFGTPPPPPPAAVPALEDVKKSHGDELKTLRAQLAAHREDPSCAACHAHFDPLGLALENFSYVGRWRETERGEPIDASGEMVTGETFNSFAELRGLIATRKDKFYRCVTEKLMTYALGRGLEPYDALTVDAITDRLLSEGGKFSTLLMAVIESPAFQMRRGSGDPAGTQVSVAETPASPQFASAR